MSPNQSESQPTAVSPDSELYVFRKDNLWHMHLEPWVQHNKDMHRLKKSYLPSSLHAKSFISIFLAKKFKWKQTTSRWSASLRNPWTIVQWDYSVCCLLQYDLEVEYKKGAELYVADALSTAYQEIEPVHMVLPISNDKLKQLQSETQKDPVLQKLKNVILNSWPRYKSNLHPRGMSSIGIGRRMVTIRECDYRWMGTYV